MPTITFANSKGGAGKTTAATLLVSELIRRGHRVSAIDADPQRWLSRWCEATPGLEQLRIVSFVSSTTLKKRIEEEEAQSQYVIVDLPGASSPLNAAAITLSDHVVIPVQGCAMDAQGGAQVLDLIDYLKCKAGVSIPHSVVLSRVSPIVTTRALQVVKLLLSARGVDVIETPIVERSAFRDLFDHLAPLHMMDPARASNLERAMANAGAFADDVLRRCALAAEIDDRQMQAA